MAGYIRPQLAFDLSVHDSADPLADVPRDGWVMEPKFDGWRWQVHVDYEDADEIERANYPPRVRCYGGRNGKEHTGTSKLIEDAAAQLPAGTVLDGELIGGGYSSDVTHLLASHQPVTMIVFDVLAVAGRSTMVLPWRERRELLEVAVPDDPHAPLRPAPVSPIDEEVYAAWMEAGMEGVVLKRMDAPYRPGSRRRDGFVKVKPSLTTDAYVTGWEWGEGASNKHKAGALQITLVDTGAATTTGWSGTPDEANAMIGRRIEVRHWGFGRSGKVRHPVFVRTRDDLETTEGDAVGKLEDMADEKLAKAPPEPANDGAWMRNYAAMGGDKLLRSIRELEAGEGEAVDKVNANGGSVEANLARAKDVAGGRGLT